jgi:hypothetical protein
MTLPPSNIPDDRMVLFNPWNFHVSDLLPFQSAFKAGEKFGCLTVIEGRRDGMYRVLCDCGEAGLVSECTLSDSYPGSCDCHPPNRLRLKRLQAFLTYELALIEAAYVHDAERYGSVADGYRDRAVDRLLSSGTSILTDYVNEIAAQIDELDLREAADRAFVRSLNRSVSCG